MLGGRHNPSGHEGCSAHHPVQTHGDQDKILTTIKQSPFSAWLVNFSRESSSADSGTDRVYPKSQCGFRKKEIDN